MSSGRSSEGGRWCPPPERPWAKGWLLTQLTLSPEPQGLPAWSRRTTRRPAGRGWRAHIAGRSSSGAHVAIVAHRHDGREVPDVPAAPAEAALGVLDRVFESIEQ